MKFLNTFVCPVQGQIYFICDKIFSEKSRFRLTFLTHNVIWKLKKIADVDRTFDFYGVAKSVEIYY